MAVCRSCGASIMWVVTAATGAKPARKMPLDADDEGRPLRIDDGTGNIVFTGLEDHEGTPIIRVLPKGKGNRRSHFASCPNAGEHRKKK